MKKYREFDLYEILLSPCNKLVFTIYEYSNAWWIKLRRFHKECYSQKEWDETMTTIYIPVDKIFQLEKAVRILKKKILDLQ